MSSCPYPHILSLPPPYTIFLQADTQSSPLLRSTCPNHLKLPRLTTSVRLWTPRDCTNPHCVFYPPATLRTSISPSSIPSSPDFGDLLFSSPRFLSYLAIHSPVFPHLHSFLHFLGPFHNLNNRIEFTWFRRWSFKNIFQVCHGALLQVRETVCRTSDDWFGCTWCFVIHHPDFLLNKIQVSVGFEGRSWIIIWALFSPKNRRESSVPMQNWHSFSLKWMCMLLRNDVHVDLSLAVPLLRTFFSSRRAVRLASRQDLSNQGEFCW